MSKLTDFYFGQGRGAGRLFEDIMAFTDEEMESTHDYIQWIFPVPEPSKWQPQSPVLTEEDLEMFRGVGAPTGRKFRATLMFMRFLSNNEHWRTPGNHNLLRITRVLRFLTLVDMSEEAEIIHTWILTEGYPGVPEKTKAIWAKALSSGFSDYR